MPHKVIDKWQFVHMKIKKISGFFSVCKVSDFSQVNFEDEFVFMAKTDEESSLVCRTASLPRNVTHCEEGWQGFRIEGNLDFTLVGILAKISTLLSREGIPIYAVSTFNTDYIFVKEHFYKDALLTLANNEFEIVE